MLGNGKEANIDVRTGRNQEDKDALMQKVDCRLVHKDIVVVIALGGPVFDILQQRHHGSMVVSKLFQQDDKMGDYQDKEDQLVQNMTNGRTNDKFPFKARL